MLLRQVVKSARLFSVLFLTFLCVIPSSAEKLQDYDKVAASRFWQNLYPGGGWSFYCGYRFTAAKKNIAGRIIDIEHIYPPSEMAKQAGCNSRMQCRDSNNAKFIKMEADIHNMYPAWQTVITHRYDFQYGLVSGEDWRFEDCDIERKGGIMEPRKIARGNIARTMLYMHTEYKIPLDEKAFALYKAWNKIDPPSDQELTRNNIIERIQGKRNPYIDQPSLVERRKLTMLR